MDKKGGMRKTSDETDKSNTSCQSGGGLRRKSLREVMHPSLSQTEEARGEGGGGAGGGACNCYDDVLQRTAACTFV